MTELHVETRGRGPDLVLLHGWAMHGGIWPASLLASLAGQFRLHVIDLPGHGHSRPLREFTLGSVTERLEDYAASHLSEPAVWLGWSLGGLLAAEMAARCPRRVRRLVLVASSLCFCRRPDWPHAMDADVLRLFAEQLQKDYRATLSRFLALQFQGDAHAREGLRRLREQLFARGEPHGPTLDAGLQILLRADCRARAEAIDRPVLLLGGEYDSLTPAVALQAIAPRFARAQVAIIEGAGHAPFVSHAEAFETRLRSFLDDGTGHE